MVFNSLTFLVFFAAVLLFYQAPLPWSLRKAGLLVASYIFYAAWNPPFVLLLLVTAIADFYLARLVHRTETPWLRRLVLIVSLTFSLGLLGVFKYGNFLLETFQALAAEVGILYEPPAFSIILPLGISFYTFETISYLVDVYRRRLTPTSSFVDYALFLTFFPHLVAGPIVRAADFLPQCATPRRASVPQFSWGLCLLIVGLFEKVILADSVMAPVADSVFDAVGRAGWVDAWIGTMAFSGQIFFDFAGYSICGIGVALCLGFVLNDNFHSPYAAIGFSDFWRRWHMSLSSWLRDYLYIPLGGSRVGPLRTEVNLMITMLLGGLWHGAAWRFVAWGGLQGSYLVAERHAKRWSEGRAARWPALPGWLLALGTFTVISVTWIFFRAPDFATSAELIRRLVTPVPVRELIGRVDLLLVVATLVVTLAFQWQLRDSSLEHLVDRMPWWARAVALAILIVAIVLAPGEDRAFIYFQF
jgi:D-alanyl-lipoteichoic acid acyltransferase DltB (MBOAT superfamily)